MSAHPIQIVEAVYDAFSRRDIPKLFSLFSSDIQIMQSEELPWGGSYRNHDGIRQFVTKLTSHINSTVAIDRLIVSGDHVAAVGVTQGTVNATGASFRVPFVHIWKVRDGLVVEVKFFIDNPTMLAALATASATPG